MALRQVHDQLGWFVIVSNGIVGLWALGAHWLTSWRIRALWWSTAVAQASIFVEGVLGVGMLADEDIATPEFHVFYGFVAMITVGIIYSYRQQVAPQRYLLYGLGGLFLMGLAIRAIVV